MTLIEYSANLLDSAGYLSDYFTGFAGVASPETLDPSLIPEAGDAPADALPAEAGEAADGAGADDNNPSESSRISPISSREFWLSSLLMIFGLTVIIAQMFFIKRLRDEERQAINIETVIRLTIVSMIIVGALILIASGYSTDQIGPAMGLFGTVAGYLLGRQDKA